jgi:hypothetical protein
VLEDPTQLADHLLDFLLGETKASEPRHVQHLLPIDHGGGF